MICRASVLTPSVIVVSSHRTYDGGGVGTHLRVLTSAMAADQCQHTVLLGSLSPFVALAKFADHLSMMLNGRLAAVLALRLRVFGLFLRLLARLAFSRSSSIIDCHDLSCVMAAALLRRFVGSQHQIVYTVHAPFYEQYSLGKPVSGQQLDELKRIELSALSQVDVFIFVDDKQCGLVSKKLGVEPVGIMLPNAVDLEFIRDETQGCERKPRIVVARNHERKCGVEFAIEAFAQARLPSSVRLRLVGDGSIREELERLAQKLEVSDRVDFLGRLPYGQALREIASARLSLVPSVPIGDYVEATSLTMLESLGLGIPLIASDIGGLRQVLSGTSAAILVPPASVSELVIAIEHVWNNSELCEQLSCDGKSLIIEKYTSEAWWSHKKAFLVAATN